MPRRPITRAAVVSLGASLGLHGAALVWVKVRPAAAEVPHVPRTDVWSGRGIELEEAPIETNTTPANAAHESELATNGERDPATLAQVSPADTREHSVAPTTACVSGCVPSGEQPKRDNRSARHAASAEPSAKSAQRVRAATATTTTTPDAPSTASGAEPAPAESFGSVGLPPGVRYLPMAYTRALSQGGWGVSGFRTASPGKLCEAPIRISVGDDRSIGPVDYGSENEREALAPLCRTLFENARRLIVNGEFSLDPKSLASGVMRLRLTVRVSDAEPRDGAEDAPNGLWSESHEPASAGRRGRSSFTLNSGRRVDAFVELE